MRIPISSGSLLISEEEIGRSLQRENKRHRNMEKQNTLFNMLINN